MDASRKIFFSNCLLKLQQSLLAYSDFVTAKTQIKLLKQQNKQGFLDAQLQRRLVLVEVKFYFLQEDYAVALKIINPLLLQSPPDLMLLATLARLEVLDSAATKMYWMNKFEQALSKESIKLTKLELTLKRLLAYMATHLTRDTQYSDIMRRCGFSRTVQINLHLHYELCPVLSW